MDGGGVSASGARAVEVHHGDSRAVLRFVESGSIDACVTDPPYALVSIVNRFGKAGAAPAKGDVYARASAGFMGKAWDTGETAFDPAFWAEVLRVLKPGAHLVAFSGTRTYHRLACAIEDAGFEIRDQLAWLYGSGFPKSHDVARSIDAMFGVDRKAGEEPSWVAEAWAGWGTALKPALEPIVLARKPLAGTVAETVIAHGCGALNVDACRVATGEDLNGGAYAGEFRERDGRTTSDQAAGARALSRLNRGAGDYVQPSGRWPANVVHDGSAEVLEAFPEASGQKAAIAGDEPSRTTKNAYGNFSGCRSPNEPRDDSGSAARFFYSAKADAEDRLGSKHPTVKPVDLMAWLCRLVTPKGGVVLDPFAGSGTTGLAALRQGFGAVLIEREAEYVADIQRRLAWARGEGRLTALETARVDEAKAAGAGLPLFSEEGE